MVAEKVRQVLGGEGMEGFVSQKKEFIGDTVLDWEPVEVDQGGGDVLPGLGVSEHPGSRVLHILEPVQGFTGSPEQDSVAVVQPGGD